jgi:hypothetical protein
MCLHVTIIDFYGSLKRTLNDTVHPVTRYCSCSQLPATSFQKIDSCDFRSHPLARPMPSRHCGDVQNIPRYPWAAKFNDRLKLDLFDCSQGYSSIEKVQNLGCILCVSAHCYGKVLSDRAMV